MRTISLNRRKIGAGVLIAAGLIALIVPFLFTSHVQPATTPPPPGGGKGGNGGGTPPCTSNCTPPSDNTPPETTIQTAGEISWTRGNTQYYYPSFKITLNAVDDENLTSITLNDTGTVTNFQVQGKTNTAELTVTANGLHKLLYYSTDHASNKETPHLAVVGLAKPDLSDLKNLIDNSAIDNSGIRNALTVKIERAQVQIALGRSPNGLNALSNQLNALEGKHGLDQARVDLLLSMIFAITR